MREYFIPWHRSYGIYRWVHGDTGVPRTRSLNYLFFDGKTPVDYCLRAVFQRAWEGGIMSALDLVDFLRDWMVHRPEPYPRYTTTRQLAGLAVQRS
jgi:hypothetical protein